MNKTRENVVQMYPERKTASVTHLDTHNRTVVGANQQKALKFH